MTAGASASPTFNDPRRVTLELHAHLRRLLIDGDLAPGDVLKQAELARRFGVSRTPMREAFRMLQEEGLIEADLNQRAVVRNYDASEVDQLYGARIALESLGVRVTAGRIEAAEVESAVARLEAMERCNTDGDVGGWMEAHRAFHGLCASRTDQPLRRLIDSHAERSERYLRLVQLRHPLTFSLAHEDHEKILAAVVDGDRDQAGGLMARHLARTARMVLHEIAPDDEGPAIREALAVNGPRA